MINLLQNSMKTSLKFINIFWSFSKQVVKASLGLVKKQKAFTLLEVLTSVFIMASLIGLIVQISYGTRNRVKKSIQLERMSLLLENKMLELKGQYTGSNLVKLPKEEEGEFEDNPEYTWFYRTQPLQLPDSNLVISLIGISDSPMNTDMVNIFKSVLSDTIVETKLTVLYQPSRGGRPTQLSLSFYFVNYEQAPDFIFNQMNKMLPEGSRL